MSGTPPRPTRDPATEAQARLARLAESGEGAPLPVPPAVWEDAQRQLAGMLAGLGALAQAMPMLGEPVTDRPTPASASAGEPMGERRAELRVEREWEGETRS